MRRQLAALLAALLAAAPALAQRQPDDSFERLARASLAQLDGRVPLPGLRDSVEIVRDRWGVPHVYARNLDDLFFAQGYVQAQDRLWQMEMYRRTFEGRLAELLGPDYVRHDRLVRLLQPRGPFSDAEYASYHPEGRRILTAFANGVNAYIAQAGDELPVEFILTGIRPTAWSPDVALLRTQTAMPVANALAELRLARDVARVGADSANRLANPSPYRDLVVPDGVDLSTIGPEVIASLQGLRTGVVRPPLLPEYQALRDARPSENHGVQEDSPGSNNWVLSGRLTESGHVIVANDPHRNVSNPSIRYVVHLNAPDWNVIGATEAVLPGVMIGHTGRIAWGLTIVGTDQSDVYVEEVNPANPNEVRFRGAWEPLRTVQDTIRVKGAAPVIVTHKYSRHGPVFHEDTVHHVAYAMRSTMHLPGSAGYLSALRYHALADCREFLDAQRYFLAPTENMICGDTLGNIAWQASGAAPARTDWHGRLPVPGTGAYEWSGLRTELPRELNPERGWIATANHDIHPPGWDPPLFFKDGPQRTRYERLESVLSSGRKFTMADMMALQHDAHSARAAADIPLFAGWTSRDTTIERARRALAEWDAQHRRESLAAAVYRYASRAIPDEARAPGTPAARRQALLEPTISVALDSLRRVLGSDPTQWRWGRINRSELPHAFVRAYDIPPVERGGGAGFVAAVGATYRQVIDIMEPDSSVATNMPGQSAQPFSPFYDDLVESYGRGEYFPLAYTRGMVERVAAHRLTLVPGASPGPQRSNVQRTEMGQLTGHTLALADGAPFRGANVFLESLLRSRSARTLAVHSDSTGYFRFDSVPPGAYVLRARYIGVGVATATVHVRAGEQRVMDLFLPPPDFDPDALAERLAAMHRQWDRWRHARPNAYAYSVHWNCFCLGLFGQWTIEVTQGGTRVVSKPGHASESAQRGGDVDALFGWLEGELGNPWRRVRVRYHPRLGYPVEIHTEPHLALLDSDTGVRITRLWAIADRE